jgi:hypothetical protein
MRLSKVASAALILGAVGFGAIGPGGAVASAQPPVPAPLEPGHGGNNWCDQWCDGQRGHGPDFRGPDFRGPDFRGPDFRGNDFRGPDSNQWDGDKRAWWASNRHDWWDDRDGRPPWGWGPPPAYQWAGGPPHPFNYWGYDVNPEWNNGFHQWGIWLLGLWIPIFGI